MSEVGRIPRVPQLNKNKDLSSGAPRHDLQVSTAAPDVALHTQLI